MKAIIAKQYHFSAAHWLPNVPQDHPCGAPHGHNYVVEIECSGEIDPTLGWVLDFGVLDRFAKICISDLDHKELNYIVQNPTAENIAAWILRVLQSTAISKYVSAVTVWETPKYWARIDAGQ